MPGVERIDDPQYRRRYVVGCGLFTHRAGCGRCGPFAFPVLLCGVDLTHHGLHLGVEGLRHAIELGARGGEHVGMPVPQHRDRRPHQRGPMDFSASANAISAAS